MTGDYIIRFAFEITEEQRERADRVFTQYGLRRAIFSKILDEVCDIVEQHGPAALGLLMANEVKPREIIPSMNKATRVKTNE